MAQKGTEPLDSGIRTDCESITGSLESINSLTDGPASASSSTQSHQSSHLQDSENAFFLDEVLANFPSDGVDTEVKDVEQEITVLKNGMQRINDALERSEAENIELKTKVNDWEGQVSALHAENIEIKTKVNDWEGQVSALRAENIELKTKVNDWEGQVSALHGQLDLLRQKALDQTTKDKEQEETHLAVVEENIKLKAEVNDLRQQVRDLSGAVNNQIVKGLQEKIKQLESEIHAGALLFENRIKAQDQQARASADENSQLKISVDHLMARDRENQQAYTAQQNTNLAFVRGDNLQDDRITAVEQDVTGMKEKVEQSERKAERLERKTDTATVTAERSERKADTATVTANSAIEGVNELNISRGLQQADGNDGDNEPVSD